MGNFADSLVKTITELGVNKHIGLPLMPNLEQFTNVYKRSKNTKHEVNSVTMSCALFKDENEVI